MPKAEPSHPTEKLHRPAEELLEAKAAFGDSRPMNQEVTA
jgi:hypothetical protein